MTTATDFPNTQSVLEDEPDFAAALEYAASCFWANASGTDCQIAVYRIARCLDDVVAARVAREFGIRHL